MFELVTAFFIGLVAWEIILFIVTLLLFRLSFKRESGFMFAIAAGAIWFYFLKLDFNFMTIAFYLAIGFGWMIFKFRRHVYKTIERYKEINMTKKLSYNASKVKERIFYEADADAVFYWIIAWPASMIGFMLHDFANYVYKQLKIMLNNIVDNMMLKAGFKETPNE